MITTVYTGPATVNGFTVLDYRHSDERSGYALCDRGWNTYDRFVTWNVYNDGRVDTHNRLVWFATAGHYFGGLAAALHDLEQRAG